MLIGCCLGKQFDLIFNLVTAVSEYTNCCGPCPMIFCIEQLTQQRLLYFVQTPAYPEGFKQMVLISLIFFLQIFHPGAHIIENLLFIVHPQFQTGTFTGAEFRELEIFEELFNRCASKDRKSTRLNSSHVASSYAVF